MAIMKQPQGMMKPPKIGAMKAAKPFKAVMPKAKMPKMSATLKAPKLGGKK